jgi:hypothetical protein
LTKVDTTTKDSDATANRKDEPEEVLGKVMASKSSGSQVRASVGSSSIKYPRKTQTEQVRIELLRLYAITN